MQILEQSLSFYRVKPMIFFRQKQKFFFCFFLVFTFFFGYWYFLDSDTELQRRVKRYFGIAWNTPVTPEAVKSAILLELPVNSSKNDIRSYIQKIGLDKDPNNECYEQQLEIFCVIGFNPNLVNLKVSRLVTYDISFKLSESKTLKDVHVIITDAWL
ncbi:hypothetical protein HC928_13985 [bacterium]|nr:hypothetical protein [bacterium]